MAAPISPVGAGTPVGAAAATKPADDPKRIAKAASQFEALLIGQLLKSMRESGTGGWLGTGDDQAGATAMEVAEEQMAEALAEQGGLGLATLVVRGLERASAAVPRSDSPQVPAQKLQP